MVKVPAYTDQSNKLGPATPSSKGFSGGEIWAAGEGDKRLWAKLQEKAKKYQKEKKDRTDRLWAVQKRAQLQREWITFFDENKNKYIEENGTHEGLTPWALDQFKKEFQDPAIKEAPSEDAALHLLENLPTVVNNSVFTPARGYEADQQILMEKRLIDDLSSDMSAYLSKDPTELLSSLNSLDTLIVTQDDPTTPKIEGMAGKPLSIEDKRDLLKKLKINIVTNAVSTAINKRDRPILVEFKDQLENKKLGLDPTFLLNEKDRVQDSLNKLNHGELLDLTASISAEYEKMKRGEDYRLPSVVASQMYPGLEIEETELVNRDVQFLAGATVISTMQKVFDLAAVGRKKGGENILDTIEKDPATIKNIIDDITKVDRDPGRGNHVNRLAKELFTEINISEEIKNPRSFIQKYHPTFLEKVDGTSKIYEGFSDLTKNQMRKGYIGDYLRIQRSLGVFETDLNILSPKQVEDIKNGLVKTTDAEGTVVQTYNIFKENLGDPKNPESKDFHKIAQNQLAKDNKFSPGHQIVISKISTLEEIDGTLVNIINDSGGDFERKETSADIAHILKSLNRVTTASTEALKTLWNQAGFWGTFFNREPKTFSEEFISNEHITGYYNTRGEHRKIAALRTYVTYLLLYKKTQDADKGGGPHDMDSAIDEAIEQLLNGRSPVSTED